MPGRSSGKKFTQSDGPIHRPQRIGIYGTGGIGKSSLAAMLPSPKFLDIEDGSAELGVKRIGGVDTWADLIEALSDDGLWKGVESVVVDTATKAEELAVAHTLLTVKNDKGAMVSSIEGYGFGKGYAFVFDTFLTIFAALDRHIRAGRNVCLICHDCTANVPNPTGEDFIRFEPRLQAPPSGKGSIRHRLKEWLDHLLFIGYDVAVSNDGKARGVGTRTIYPTEMPTHWAKSRVLADPIVFKKESSEIWNQLFKKGK